MYVYICMYVCSVLYQNLMYKNEELMNLSMFLLHD